MMIDSLLKFIKSKILRLMDNGKYIVYYSKEKNVPHSTPTTVAMLDLTEGVYVVTATSQWSYSAEVLVYYQLDHSVKSDNYQTTQRGTMNSGGGASISQIIKVPKEGSKIKYIVYRGAVPGAETPSAKYIKLWAVKIANL